MLPVLISGFPSKVKTVEDQYKSIQMVSTSIALVLMVKNLDDTNAAYGAVQNFIDVYEGEVNRIAIIGPSNIDIDRDVVDPIPISQSSSSSHFLYKIVDFIRYQVRISRKLWQERSQTNLIFFHIGGSLLLLPIVLSRFSRLRSLIFITGSIEKGLYIQYGHGLFSKILITLIRILESLTCSLSDGVILLSESMTSPRIHWPFSTEIRIANFNYINCDVFKKRTRIKDRTVDIVFVGRLEPIKGAENIIQALPALIDRYPRLQMKFIGTGGQKRELEKFVKKNDLGGHVTFTGWVNREELPDHLNDAQILLMPSLSEGVPKTILEAMSCGTIPIASSVGGIPDIIEDTKNGFLLKDVDPETIEQRISSVLERDDLEIISNNAHQYIRKHHSYNSIQDQYRIILDENKD